MNSTQNGYQHENENKICEATQLIKKSKEGFEEIYFKVDENKTKFIYVPKSYFLKYMRTLNEFKNNHFEIAHGVKQPDEVLINLLTRQIIVIEFKSQKTKGSVCEKLQTAPFKRENLRTNFKGYEVHYIYVLSNWFLENARVELKYLESQDIKVFWGFSNKRKLNSFISYILSL